MLHRLLTALVAALVFAGCGTVTPTQSQAAVCADYANQQQAQERADTIDADGDGIYCELLPCPCSDATKNSQPSTPTNEKSDKTYTYRGRITQVIDGDTLKVRYDGRVKTVRVIGIDTPESNKPNVPVECGAKEATSTAFEWAFKRKLDRDGDGLYDHGRGGRTVMLRTDSTQDKTDKYGRLLAYVTSRGRDFGQSQINKGWAEVFVFANNPFTRFAAYEKSAVGAQGAELGVWAKCGGDFHSRQ
ncbi:MAG: thermonuclease family protein [Solirubrobacterales bacterium]